MPLLSRRGVGIALRSFFGVTLATALVQAAPPSGPGPALKEPSTASSRSASPQAVPPTQAPPTSAPSTPAQMEEARERYRRALELFDEGTNESLEAALLELERAYALAPSYRLLYNVGLVSMQLRQFARAYEAFSAYLQQGGAEIPPGRADEVKGHLAKLEVRTGTITVIVDAPGAEVAIDDVVVGRAPLGKPIRVSAGRRRVSVTWTGRSSERVLEIAGTDKSTVSFELISSSASAVSHEPSAHKPIPWIWWGSMAAAGIGAGVAGIIALNASSAQSSDLNQLNTSRANLTSANHTLVASSIVADSLGVIALGLGAVSLYLTLKAPAKADAPRVGLRVSPRALSLEVAAF